MKNVSTQTSVTMEDEARKDRILFMTTQWARGKTQLDTSNRIINDQRLAYAAELAQKKMALRTGEDYFENFRKVFEVAEQNFVKDLMSSKDKQ